MTRHSRVLPPAAWACALLVLAPGCKSDRSEESVDVLPAASEIDIATPMEAAWDAEQAITPANVDAAFEALVKEVEAEEGR